jgi:hypothetical protein
MPGKLDESATQFEQALLGDSTNTLPVNPPPANPPADIIVPDNKDQLTWEKLSEALGEPLKSVDDIKSKFSSFKEASTTFENSKKELEGKLSKRDQEVADYISKTKETEDLLSKYADPLTHFGGDAEEYKKVQIKLALKNSGEQKNIDAAMRLLDGKSLSDFDKIKLFKIYNNPKADEATVDKLLAKTYDLDLEDRENWDVVTKLQMSEEALRIDQEMSKISSSIKLPEKIDFAANKKKDQEQATTEAAKNKSDWESIKEKLPLTEIPLSIKIEVEKEGKPVDQELPFTYKIPEEDIKVLREIAIKVATEDNSPFTKENLEWIAEQTLDHYYKVNRLKIEKAKYESWRSIWQKEHDDLEHVKKQPDKKDAPGSVDQDETISQWQKASADMKGK